MSLPIPKKGDFISYFFTDHSGHEQKGRRPALLISNDAFNKLTGIAFICPITNTNIDYPFHIPIPKGNKVCGVIMADQIKAIDFKARKVSLLANAPDGLLEEVTYIIDKIIN